MTDETPTPGRRKPLISAWAPRVAFESLLIVFSVLLALVLNGWREDAASRREALVAVAGIRAEVEENARKVAAVVAYNEELLEGLREASTAGAATLDRAVVSRGYFRSATVLDAGWSTAQNTDLPAALPYETVLQLSAVYALQEEYVTVNEVVGQSLFDIIISEGIDGLLARYANYALILQDQVDREHALLTSYEDALAQLP